MGKQVLNFWAYLVLFSLAMSPGFGAEPTTTVQPSLPTPTKSDEQGSNSAAQTMAMMGAAMAGSACAMLMNEARKATGSEKTKLMAQAMAQCAQAAASAAAGMQNGQGAKNVTMADVPQMPGFKVEDQKYDTDPKPVDKSAFEDNGDTAAKDPGNFPDPEVPETPNFAITKTPDRNSNPFGNLGNDYGPRAPGYSLLDPIDQSGIRFTEKDPKTAGADAGGFGTTAARSLTADASKNAVSSSENGKYVDVPSLFPAKGKGVETAGDGEGGAEAGAAASGGDNAFDNLMAQIMGGGASAAEAMGFGSGKLDISFLPFDKVTNTQPNIFQYASLRYSNLEKEKAVERSFKPHSFKVTTAKAD